jgi:hypothetical protein
MPTGVHSSSDAETQETKVAADRIDAAGPISRGNIRETRSPMPHAAEEATSRDRTQPVADLPGAIPRGRLWLMFALFFSICCGLGYPSLNRVDWRQAGDPPATPTAPTM